MEGFKGGNKDDDFKKELEKITTRQDSIIGETRRDAHKAIEDVKTQLASFLSTNENPIKRKAAQAQADDLIGRIMEKLNRHIENIQIQAHSQIEKLKQYYYPKEKKLIRDDSDIRSSIKMTNTAPQRHTPHTPKALNDLAPENNDTLRQEFIELLKKLSS